MGTIALEGMEFFAYHGCFQEEQIIGTTFLVDLEVDFDTSKSELSDHLEDTINYQTVYGLVHHEMEQKSQLLENVARRILDSLKSTFPEISDAGIKISKVNPPLGGKVNRVSCMLDL